MSREKEDFDSIFTEAANLVGFIDDEQSAASDTIVGPYRGTTYSDRLVVHEHPFKETWRKDDLAEIDRIRRLGRFMIDDTKRRIVVMTDLAYAKHVDIYNHFVAKDWRILHSEPQGDLELSRLPTAANPGNIATYPFGGYVNCLGVSIGLVALAELSGFDYLYASELRTSDPALSQNFTGLESKIKKIVPRAYEPDALPSRALEVYELNNGGVSKESELYTGLPIVSEGIFEKALAQELRDYHHFILSSQDDDKGDFVVQLDPFNLIFIQHSISPVEVAELRAMLAAGDSAVVTDDTIEKTYKVLNDCLDRVLRLTPGEGDTLSATTMQASRSVIEAHYNELVEESPHSTTADKILDVLCSNVAVAQCVALAECMEMDAERVGLLDALGGDDKAGVQVFFDKIIDEFKKRVPYESRLKNLNIDLTRMYPLALYMQFYRMTLQSWLRVRETGAAGRSLEVGETDFTIGCMFLNHYANNRKDGKINVARYLARYSSSQLIWLAASCDGESMEDPFVLAMGERVRSLKPAQMHPRVHLVVKHSS